jgi:hypothetical protein
MNINMVTVIKFSDTIPPQEYERKRDKVIEILTKLKGDYYLMGLSYLVDSLKLDEYHPPAYVVSRMADEGILEHGAIYHIRDNKRVMTVGYRLKQ